MKLKTFDSPRQVLVIALWALSKGIDIKSSLPGVFSILVSRQPQLAPLMIDPLLNHIPLAERSEVLRKILDNTSCWCLLPEFLRRFPMQFPFRVIFHCIRDDMLLDLERILCALPEERRKTIRIETMRASEWYSNQSSVEEFSVQFSQHGEVRSFGRGRQSISLDQLAQQRLRIVWEIYDKLDITLKNPKNIEKLKQLLEGTEVFQDEWQDE